MKGSGTALPCKGVFRAKEEMCLRKNWTWWHNKGKKFHSQWQREAWSRQGLDEQSQQQLRSNLDLALQLTYVKACVCL